MTKIGVGTNNLVRFTGFFDIDTMDLTPIAKRKEYLVKFAKALLGEENYDDSRARHWVGLRPVSADDVPIIGKSTRYQNLYWNTGQGSRGVSNCTSSSDLIARYFAGEAFPEDLHVKDYDPARFKM